MSRARERREQARMKRQAPNHFPDTGNMVDDDQCIDERDDELDDPECDRCRGDGMDPMCDHLLPCPLCQGEQH